MKEKLGMWLTVNRNCNMRCKWCYASTTKYDECKTMDFEFAKKILKFANDLEIKRMVIIGGEPTIYDHISDVVKQCYEYGMNSSIVTNGVKYADESFLKELIQSGLSFSTLSLKALTREKYKIATGTDKFNDFVLGLENVRRLKLNHQLCFTMTEYFDDKVDDLMKLLKEFSPQNVYIDVERPELNPEGNKFVAGNNIDKLAGLFEEMYIKLRETNLNFRVGCYIPFCKLSSNLVNLLLEDKRIGLGCHLMVGKSIIVEPNGNVIPCNHMCNIPLARFDEDFSTAEEYLEYRKSKQYVDLISRMNYAPDERCVSCKLWSVCGGSCRLRWMLDKNPLD